MVTTENEEQKQWVSIHSFLGKDRRVKLCFVTIGVTSCLLEAHDMREVEISNKHLLKTYSGTPTWCFTFISHLIFIAICARWLSSFNNLNCMKLHNY